MKNSSVEIKKASGETEPFDVAKLKASVQNAGAAENLINEIAADIEEWVYEGVTTQKIYERAYKLLQRKSGSRALRYKLKKALFNFGPTGYPFEHFIGELFKKQGYATEVAQVVDGRCITHEMDVIATKDGKQYLMECKFAHDQGNRLSIQVPLYVRSRVDDIIEKRKQMPEYKDVTFSAWVVTNARFSSDSIDYSKCSGLNLLGWDYPKGNGLKDIIERVNIFPITILSHLAKKEKQQLMEQGIVTCSQLWSNTTLLNSLGLSKKKQRNVLKELDEVTEKK
ncbi:MAG TPA: ATP-binding protein [bacterium]|nr:ATP-binding protein [bacterium]